MTSIEQFLSYTKKAKTQDFSFKGKLAALDAKFGVIDPYERFYNFWRVVMTLIICYYFFEIPLVLGFSSSFEKQIQVLTYSKLIFSISTILLFMDILISFNLGYYENGLFVCNRWQIVHRYIRKELIIDVWCVIILPLDYFTYNLALNILKLLFILKIMRLSRYDREFLYLLSTHRLLKLIYKFSRLILIIMFYSHVLACIFFFMDYTFYTSNFNNYVDNGYLWLLTAQCMNDIVLQYGWAGRYLYALYWSIGTVSTVGYGDIFPANPWENLFQLLVIINICVLFGYFVNNVFLILGEYHQVSSKLKSLMHDANYYLQKMRVSRSLRIRIRRYLEFAVIQQGERDKDQQQEILSKFSEIAYMRICYEQYKGFIFQLPFVDVDQPAKLRIASKVIQHTHFQDEVICGDVSSVYLAEKGKIVEYYLLGQYDRFPVRVIPIDRLFKLYEFVTGVSSGKTYRSKRYSELLELKREDYLVHLNEKFNEEFFMMREKVLFENLMVIADVQCSVCHQRHLEQNCPYLHYICNPKHIERKKTVENQRSFYQRSNKINYNNDRFNKIDRSLNNFESMCNFIFYRQKHNIDTYEPYMLRN